LKENLQGSDKENKEEDGNNEEESKDGQRKIAKGTPLSAFY